MKDIYKNEFSKFSKEQNFEFECIIQSHEKKDRIVAVARRSGGNRSIVKWNGQNEEHRGKLAREIQYYKDEKGSRFRPALISSGEDYIELEYIEGVSLRRWLVEGKDHSTKEADRVFENYVGALNVMSDAASPSPSDCEDTVSMLGFLGRVLSSGPMDVRRSVVNDWIVNRYRRMVLEKAESIIATSFRSIADCAHHGWCHFDLHLNNVLVRPNGDIAIVDWENRRRSTLLSDAVYSSSMIYQLLGSDRRRQAFNIAMGGWKPMADASVRAAFCDMMALFAQAIAANSRFHDRFRPLSLARAHMLLLISL